MVGGGGGRLGDSVVYLPFSFDFKYLYLFTSHVFLKVAFCCVLLKAIGLYGFRCGLTPLQCAICLWFV